MSQFASLKQYRYQPRSKESGGKKNGVPKQFPDVICIGETPESSPRNSPQTSKSTVAKRGAVVLIDSDSDEEASHKKQRTDSSTSSPWLNVNSYHPDSQGSCSSSTVFSDSTWTPPSTNSMTTSPNWTANPNADYDQKLTNLKIMFPSWPKYKLKDVLARLNWNVDEAITFVRRNISVDEGDRQRALLNYKPPMRQQHSTQSTSSQDSEVRAPVRRRVRQLTDSSAEEDNMSQENQSAGLECLSLAFPDQRKETLVRVLQQCDGCIKRASSTLAAMEGQRMREANEIIESPTHGGSIKAIQAHRHHLSPAKAQNHHISKSPAKTLAQLKAKANGRDEAMSDDELDEELEVDSEDSDEEFANVDKSANSPLMLFFNEATVNELMSMPGCSKKKALLLSNARPFKDWEDLVNKLYENKLIALINGCREMMHMRKVVDGLMQKCESIGERMQSIITQLSGATQLQDIADTDSNYIRTQSQLLTQSLRLKPYQIVGVNWLLLMHKQELNGILADEMGLGKTIQTIAFLTQLLEDGDQGPHCIIAPSSTLDNWLRELSVWSPSLKVLLYYGNQEERGEIREQVLDGSMEEFHVLLTTYNMATGSIEDRSLFKKGYFSYAVFDEGHMLKNMSSLRYQNLMKIRAERRLLLTGTPLQNNLIELMSLLAFVMPEFFVGKTDHLKQMFTTITNLGSKEDRGTYEKATVIRAKKIMRPFFLRRLKSEVLQQLPAKTSMVEHVGMTTTQQALYDSLKAQFAKTVKEVHNTGTKSNQGSAMLMDLRKAANHPLLHRRHYTAEKLRQMSKLMIKEPTHREANPDLIFEDMEVMSDFELHKLCKNFPSIGSFTLSQDLILDAGKFQWLDDHLPLIKEKGDRVLLFSQFTMMLDVIEHYLKIRKHRFIRLDGGTPVADRQELIDQFTAETDIFIFLLSTRAGGLGINLTAANTVVLHDIDFNPYNDKQAEDRCHRLGQNSCVSVFRLLSQHTIEEGIHRCAEGKLQLEADVTGYKKEKSEENQDVLTLLQDALKSDS